jgi:outer membrane immunogenic protein
LKNLAVASAILAATTCLASAADLPARTAPPIYAPPPLIFAWKGFYTGLNAGAAFGSGKSNLVPSPLWFTSGLASDQANANGMTATGHRDLSSTGFTGGGQIGYNYQIASFVVGLEGDFEYNGLKKSSDATYARSNDGHLFNVLQSYKSDWLATIRPRVGYAFGSALLYATGGVAFTNLKIQDDHVSVSGGTDFPASASKTLTGWTVGGGLEYALTQNWTLKVEYLYANFGKIQASGIRVPSNGEPYSISYRTNFAENIARLGVNYKF